MKRRTFLKTTVATAGGLLLGVGCSSPSPPESSGDSGFQDTQGADLPSDAVLADGTSPLELGEQYFPQSLMSGDPTATSVILWTRFFDAGFADADVALKLHVAVDESFETLVELDGEGALDVSAEASSDHCVKVAVRGLNPATTYYYRFSVDLEGQTYVTRTGRTKTAPAPDADVKVRFAYVSCQDYNGRYYNPYVRLAEADVDFIVHLGDYVYETTGNPEFQNTEGRRVEFTNEADAIVFHEGEESEYHAAKSLSNYRDLYKIYRSDEAIQRVHELFPMICIWDDHEFSNDAYGATATYFDDTVDETDVPRKKAANQAYYEYMPIDYPGQPDFKYDPAVEFPGDMRIHRDLRFGKHVHLVLTDLRTYRADHVVPEGAFPGAVIATEEDLISTHGTLPNAAAPYVDIETYAEGAYATALKKAAATMDFEEADVTGNIGVSFINTTVSELNELDEGGEPVALISVEDQADLKRGLFYGLTGKSFYSDLGSRFLAIREPFEAICAYRYMTSNGASEETMGPEQEAWFLETMKGSDATWKIWGNEYCLNSLNVDLTAYEILPENYRQQFSLLVEDWTGMPNRRDKMIGELSDVGNVVAITGDVHAFFAGTPYCADDPSKRIVELVTGSISSSPLRSEFIEKASSNPSLAEAGAPALAYGIVGLLQDPVTKPSPQLAYANITDHGFVVLEVGADKVDAEFHFIKGSTDTTNLYADATLNDQFETMRFTVKNGENALFHDEDGSLKRWDVETASWG
jgi:alkaline phosphatase D